MQGSTEECFADLTNKISSTRGRTALAGILEVDYAATFCRWITEGLKAKGVNLIRLRIMLELLGYEVLEWRGLPTVLHYIAEDLSYEVQTLDQVRQGLGYKTTKDVLRLLLRGSGMYPDREAAAKQFVASIESDVVQARMAFHTRMELAHPEIAELLVPMSKPRDQEQILVPNAVHLSNQELMGVFAAQLNAMLPLARYFSGDSVTAEERTELRKLAGYEQVSEFSLVLRNLTSEKTREKLAESKKGGRIR